MAAPPSASGAITVRYVAKDWRKQFKFAPETSVTQAVTTCLTAFNCGDREAAFPPQQQYGLYLFRKGAAGAGWLDNASKIGQYNIASNETVEFHNRSDFIQLPVSMMTLHTHYAEGWLTKRGAVNTSWKLRWFVLRNRILSYYKKKTRSASDEAAGTIELNAGFDFGLIPIDVKAKRTATEDFQFHITRPGRIYVLCAQNRPELEHWLRILKTLRAEGSHTDLSDAEDEGEAPATPASPLSGGGTSGGAGGGDDGDDDDDDDMTDVPLKEGARALPVDANGLPAGDKAGYMGKRNRSGQWKIRWFVLKDKVLQYYKGTSCKGFINMEGATITDDSKAGKGHVFKLVVPSRTYYLNVEDPKDFGEWCEAFEFVAGVPVGGRTEDGDDKDDSAAAGAIVEFLASHLSWGGAVGGGQEGPVRLQGHLMKQGNNFLADWRKRWFTLRGQTLYYRKSPDSKDVLGSIPLSASTLREVPGRRPFAFELAVANRQYQLQATAEDDYQKWLAALRPLVKAVDAKR